MRDDRSLMLIGTSVNHLEGTHINAQPHGRPLLAAAANAPSQTEHSHWHSSVMALGIEGHGSV